MSDTQAKTTIAVSRTCEDADCDRPADVSMIAHGGFGVVNAAIVAYCDDCADYRADSDNHRAIGKVTRR